MTSTTLTSWALLIWQTLKNRDLDPRPFFEQAHLDPAKLGDGNARYPMSGMFELWTAIEDVDELIGVEVGLNWSPTTFHALGYAWLASNSLKDAMMRLSRYAGLISNAMNASLEFNGEHYVFRVNTSEIRGLLHPLGADAGTAAFLTMFRMLCGKQFSPLEVHARRGPSAGTRRLEQLYGTPINYNAGSAWWVIDRRDVEAVIIGGNSELARINEEIAEKTLLRITRSDIVTQVKQAITEQLPSGYMDEKSIAENLNMSVRTLHRKLQEKGLGFAKMVANIRETLALHYIEESHLTLTEIGYLLGFSEQASLSRAFKRWTGSSPSQFRKHLSETGPV